MFIPEGDDILIPPGNDAFIPFRYDTIVPLRHNVEIPILLSAKEDRSRYFNNTVNVGFRAFDTGGNGGVGKYSLYRRDDVGVKYDALIFCQAATYRRLELCILWTHRERVDGERKEK